MKEEKTADEYLFREDDNKIKFRSMIVPEKVLENDNLQKDKV